MTSPRYYRALFSLLDGRFAVVHFTAANDSAAYGHASDCVAAANGWPAGMMLRDVTFIGLDAPRAELGSLIVSGHFGRRTA
jgi:hypothetical protein